MNLIKAKWDDKDIEEFYEFEKTLFSDKKSCEWEQKIVNTKLKCFGKTANKAKGLVRELKKGNYIEFVSKLQVKTHLDSLITAYLICLEKDYNAFEKMLDKFVLTIDNWASSDTLSFKKKDKEKLYLTATKYLKSDKTFVRRTGVNIYFELIKEEKYLDKTFELLDGLKDEKEYYVNMCSAWLLCECFIKFRDKTMEYFKNNSTNSFIINKAISKCRDSFRVSLEDKNLLNLYKK